MRAQIGLVIALLVWCSGVLADGGFFQQAAAGPVGEAYTTQQHAIVAFDGETETLVLRTAYAGEGQPFVWVIPTPALLTQEDVSTVTDTVFEVLDEGTAPQQWFEIGGGGGGCSCGGDSGASGVGDAVAVFDHFAVDNYEITVLSSTESAALIQWLNDNGYAVPQDAEGVLTSYVDEGWYFAAVRVNPTGPHQVGGRGEFEEPISSDVPPPDSALAPLCLRFAADRPVYPLRISASSTPAPAEILLYVVAHHRFEPQQFPWAQVSPTPAPSPSSFRQHYALEFRAQLEQLGQPGFLIEFAGSPSGLDTVASILQLGAGPWFVTRLRTIMASADMQTKDVYLQQSPSDNAFSVELTGAVAQRRPLGAFALALVAATLTGLSNRHREQWWLRSMACGLLVMLLL